MGLGLLNVKVSRSLSHTTQHFSERTIGPLQNLYLTTHNTQKIHTSLPTEEYEPTSQASEWPQTHGHEERPNATNYYSNEDVAAEQFQFVFRI